MSDRSRLIAPGTCGEWSPQVVEVNGECTRVWCVVAEGHTGQHVAENQFQGFRFAWPNANGPVITIDFAGKVPPQEMGAFLDAVAAVVHSFEPRSGWDPLMSSTGCDVLDRPARGVSTEPRKDD